MNKILKTLTATTFAIAVGTGIYEASRASQSQEQARALLLQRDSLTEQIQLLQEDYDRAAKSLAVAQNGSGRSHDQSELLRLRAEVTKLRNDSRELAQLKGAAFPKGNDPAESEMRSWVSRVNKLKERLGQLPDQKIPELQFLTDQDWLDAVRDIKHLDTEADSSKALSALRNSARNEFAGALQNALRGYAQAGNNQAPTDLAQLKPYFASFVDESVLQRYEFAQPGMVTTKASPLDEQDDKYYQISMNTIGVSSGAENTLQQAVEAFSAANTGQNPTDPAQLLPYVKTPAEQAALQNLIQKAAK